MSKEFKTKRKITYNSGIYKLSIPKMYIENMGLEAGSEVYLVYVDEDTLMIKRIKKNA